MAFVTNAGMGTPFGDLRIIRLSSAVANCVRDRSLRQEQGLEAAPLEPLRV